MKLIKVVRMSTLTLCLISMVAWCVVEAGTTTNLPTTLSNNATMDGSGGNFTSSNNTASNDTNSSSGNGTGNSSNGNAASQNQTNIGVNGTHSGVNGTSLLSNLTTAAGNNGSGDNMLVVQTTLPPVRYDNRTRCYYSEVVLTENDISDDSVCASNSGNCYVIFNLETTNLIVGCTPITPVPQRCDLSTMYSLNFCQYCCTGTLCNGLLNVQYAKETWCYDGASRLHLITIQSLIAYLLLVRFATHIL